MVFLLVAWGLYLGGQLAPAPAPAAEPDPGPEWVEPVNRPKSNEEDEMAEPTIIAVLEHQP